MKSPKLNHQPKTKPATVRIALQTVLGIAFALSPGQLKAEREAYPVSRFGQAPSQAPLALDALRPGDEADWADRAVARGSRTPAGAPIGEGAEDEGVPTPVAREPEGLTASNSQEMAGLGMRRKGVQEVALIAGDLGFFPKTVFVNRDVPVRLFVTGASRSTLCILVDQYQVRKQVRSQKIEEITFTPTEPGKFRFHCPINGMEGTLVVRETSLSVAGTP